MTTMNTESSEREEAPERFWIAPQKNGKFTDTFRVSQYSTFDGATEYIRADIAAVGGDAAEVLRILVGRHHAQHHKQFPAESCPAWPCDLVRNAAAASSLPAEPPNDACSHWREGDSDNCVWCGDDLGPTTEADIAPLQPEGKQENVK